MSCEWEGNRRSGVALAMHHRLTWFINLRAQGLKAKFHYASWFEAGSELVSASNQLRTSFEAGSVIEFGFK